MRIKKLLNAAVTVMIIYGVGYCKCMQDVVDKHAENLPGKKLEMKPFWFIPLKVICFDEKKEKK